MATMDVQSTAEQWVSVDRIAKNLSLKVSTIYKWLERKDMPAHKHLGPGHFNEA